MDELTGRELDKAIAERVFGIKKIFRPCDYPNKGWDSSDDWHFIRSGKSPKTHMIDAQPIPMFSVSVAAAWRVVEQMRAMEDLFQLEFGVGGQIRAAFWYPAPNASKEFVSAETAPLAICRAALKALVER